MDSEELEFIHLILNLAPSQNPYQVSTSYLQIIITVSILKLEHPSFSSLLNFFKVIIKFNHLILHFFYFYLFNNSKSD